jgi:hypothetical protein
VQSGPATLNFVRDTLRGLKQVCFSRPSTDWKGRPSNESTSDANPKAKNEAHGGDRFS